MARPWDRLPGESRQAYAAFEHYKNMGPKRSLNAAYRGQREGNERVPKSRHREGSEGAPGRWRKWCGQWAWVRRSDAWDQYRREVAERAVLGETTRLARQQVRATQVATARALERLTRMQSQELRPMEAMRLLVEAAKLRRDELGSLAALNAAGREQDRTRRGDDGEDVSARVERDRPRVVDPERTRQVLQALLEIGALDVGPTAPASSDDGDEGIPWEDA